MAPNYSPGPQESAFVMALNSVIQTIVMSSISVLSMGLANQLLAPLGLGNSGISGALGSGAVGVASGESVGNAASNVGVASVYTGGGAVNTTAQNKIQQSLSTNQPLPPVQVAPVQMNNSKINTSSASDSQAVPAGN